VDFRFSQGCEHAAEEDLRLARDPGTDDEGRSTTVTWWVAHWWSPLLIDGLMVLIQSGEVKPHHPFSNI